MKSKHDELLKKLLATFRLEADGHLQNMVAGLLSLEKTPVAEQSALVETIFRAAHSLKGAARAVNLTQIEAVCRSLENVFSATKDASPDHFIGLDRPTAPGNRRCWSVLLT